MRCGRHQSCAHTAYFVSLRVLQSPGLEGSRQNSLLDLGNSLSDLNATRASLGAVEGCAAAPHTFFIVEDFQTQIPSVITRIEDKTMRIHDGRRTEVLTVRPENGARGGTSRAQNTLCGVVE